jgi:hypothetical protein
MLGQPTGWHLVVRADPRAVTAVAGPDQFYTAP